MYAFLHYLFSITFMWNWIYNLYATEYSNIYMCCSLLFCISFFCNCNFWFQNGTISYYIKEHSKKEVKRLHCSYFHTIHYNASNSVWQTAVLLNNGWNDHEKCQTISIWILGSNNRLIVTNALKCIKFNSLWIHCWQSNIHGFILKIFIAIWH